MTTVLAGAAAHNAGQYGVARAVWAGGTPIDPGSGDGDDNSDAAARLLDALTAFATAVTESRRGDWEAARTAATRASRAIESVDGGDVDVEPIERWLAAFLADPELAERSPPPSVPVAGDRPTPGELPLAAAAVVAGTIAEGRGEELDVVRDALRYARESEYPERTRYATFLRDYAAAESGSRAIVFERLSGLVARRRRKEDDVSELFD
ncbi:MAG: hypothetical protein ACOCQU_05115 [Halolamina sp.]